MSLDQIGAFIKDVGFPVFVCCYFLFSLNGSLREIKSELRKLSKNSRLYEEIVKKTD